MEHLELRPEDVVPPVSISCATKSELWEKVRIKHYTPWFRLIALAELERRGVSKGLIRSIKRDIEISN